QGRRRILDPDDEMSLVPRIGLRLAGIVLAGGLSACAGSLPGSVSEEPAAPKLEMTGRWLLSAPNSPPCGMAFGASEPPAPEGGCPDIFSPSRHWTTQGNELTILDHNSEPLAQLRFADGQFQGKATGGMVLTLARSGPPAN